MVSWPLLERAGEEREEDLDGRIRPGLGVLRVRVLESRPGGQRAELEPEVMQLHSSPSGHPDLRPSPHTEHTLNNSTRRVFKSKPGLTSPGWREKQ